MFQFKIHKDTEDDDDDDDSHRGFKKGNFWGGFEISDKKFKLHECDMSKKFKLVVKIY